MSYEVVVGRPTIIQYNLATTQNVQAFINNNSM
jgi:hypothetical protein